MVNMISAINLCILYLNKTTTNKQKPEEFESKKHLYDKPNLLQIKVGSEVLAQERRRA